MLAGILYLNTCEKGGETEFPVIGKSMKTERGKLILFPSYFTHIHFSNPANENRYALVMHVRETPHPSELLQPEAPWVQKIKKLNEEGEFDGEKKTNNEGSKNSNR